jgi:hypothetical protein
MSILRWNNGNCRSMNYNELLTRKACKRFFLFFEEGVSKLCFDGRSRDVELKRGARGG